MSGYKPCGGDGTGAMCEQQTWECSCALCPVASRVRKEISVNSSKVLGGPQTHHGCGTFGELCNGRDKAPGSWAVLCVRSCSAHTSALVKWMCYAFTSPDLNHGQLCFTLLLCSVCPHTFLKGSH